jgi:outer membrane receptor protein involved in Fe transport
VGSLGLTLQDAGPWTGGLRLRHIGPRPLTEDGTIRSQPFTLADLRLGYRLSGRMSLTLDVLNLAGTRASDIEYWYRSRLPGEALAGAEDRHLHPAEPRTVRLSLRMRF